MKYKSAVQWKHLSVQTETLPTPGKPSPRQTPQSACRGTQSLAPPYTWLPVRAPWNSIAWPLLTFVGRELKLRVHQSQSIQVPKQKPLNRHLLDAAPRSPSHSTRQCPKTLQSTAAPQLSPHLGRRWRGRRDTGGSSAQVPLQKTLTLITAGLGQEGSSRL